MGDEQDVGWDGGWGDMVDHGHDLGEYMLTAPHPYDRDDGYIPPPRWETRHELVSRPFADPASMIDGGLAVTFDPAGGRPPIRSTASPRRAEAKRPRPAITAEQARKELARRKRNRAARKRPGGIVVAAAPSLEHVASMSKQDLQRVAGNGPAVAPKGVPTNASPAGVVTARVQMRAAATARRLGLTTDQVLAVIRGEGSHREIALRLGWDVGQVKQVHQTYVAQVGASRSSATSWRANAAPAAPRGRVSRPAPESYAKPLWVAGKAPTETCASCGVAINVNSGCRCS